MIRSPRTLPGLVVLAATLAGCAERPVQAAGADLPLWRLRELPTLTIGGHDERSAFALSGVRGALLLDDGRIAIADGLSREIRLFSAEGAHLHTLGGEGGGPGEFSGLSSLSHGPGGGVCAWDARPSRITCFPAGDGAPTTAEVDPDALLDMFGARFIGAFPDGSFVMQDRVPTIDQRDEPTGERRDTVSYLQFAADGSLLRVIVRLPGTETYFLNEDRVWGGEEILFGRRALDHLDGVLAIGVNDSLDLRVVAPSGGVAARIAAQGSLRPVRAEEVDSARARLLRELEASESRRTFRSDAAAMERVARWGRKQIATRPHRATMPAFERLRIAHDGMLWIAAPAEASADHRTWTVVDPATGPVAHVEIAVGAEVLDVESDRLLLLVRDELDVESVMLVEVEKS